MFREIKRKEQRLSHGDAIEILKSGEWGVLSVNSDDGYPYGVPVNYAYDDGHIYFHGALSGHRWDALQKGDKVSFTVVAEDRILQKEYTTAYASVIAFGRVHILEGEGREKAFIKMTDRLAPDVDHAINLKTVQHCARAALFSIDIEHMTGKVGRTKVDR